MKAREVIAEELIGQAYKPYRAADSILSALDKAGYAVVPKEPEPFAVATVCAQYAGRYYEKYVAEVYRRMLAAHKESNE